jgi:pimeloyl-ACP methyl ester carboxylesterase
MLGFGRSSRPVTAFQKMSVSEVYMFNPFFCPTNRTSLVQVENYFLESIEQWREAMDIKKFNLLGHSFGGYDLLP